MASNTALGFDTGLDARAFAQAQFAQAITEPGLIVRGGSAGLWKASGVFEFAGDDGRLSLVVWGPPFEGDHLDLLLNGDKDQALAAICLWIQAVMTAGENSLPAPFWPCAAMIESNGESKDHAIPAVFLRRPAWPGAA
uniref:Uncharacterized protein n=1 Tax=uncultured bacterium contig00061 TaxID=1181544 RepID=A0A806KKT4_9BACT|nr:hypothetical protein [uncultured bacterium contig00061]